MRPRVAVLHHPGSFFPLDLVEEVGDAAELLWVVDDDVVADEATIRLLKRLGTVVDVTGLDPDASARRLADARPDGVVAFVDAELEAAAALAARLDLRYHTPEVAAVLVDKRRQRAALDRAGIPGPAFWPVSSGLTAPEIADLAQRITYPAVLKPAVGTGSRGMARLESPDELPVLLADHARSQDCLVEEYLPDAPSLPDWCASYLSVESVVARGHVTHVALTGRFPLAEPFRETGNFIPAVVEPRIEAECLALVDAAIDCLGITDAVLHTEIKRTPDGLRLVEVNGRLGGRPPFVLASVSDVNLFRAACQVAAGARPEVTASAPCDGVGFWLMLQAPIAARRVVRIDGLDDLCDTCGVEQVHLNRRPGDLVDWREGTDGHVVTVRGRVADHRALEEAVRCIRTRVSIVYDCVD